MPGASPRVHSPAGPELAVEALLAAAGVALEDPGAAQQADLEWARSGAMALCGPAQGAPRLAPAPLASRARAVAEALARLAPAGGFDALDGAALLGERAALLGLTRRGRVAPGGACRLLPAKGGWLAVNLARPDDRTLLPAWLGAGSAGDSWDQVAARVSRRCAEELLETARLLGLPVALAAPVAADSPPPWARVRICGATHRPAGDAFRVVDLSSLWAGPLCAQLLAQAGARVLKLESTARPDGARAGPVRFFDLLNGDKASVAFDFTARDGPGRLVRLLEHADVVIESSRPRALRQLGICAEDWLRRAPGRTWVSITGYGRREPAENWVAFGDDAAAAAGLAAAVGDPGPPLFCGDAVADPLAGLHAALAALASQRCGGGHLLDVPLRDGVAHLLALGRCTRRARVERTREGWNVVLGELREAVQLPRARPARAVAPPLGADTGAVLARCGVSC